MKGVQSWDTSEFHPDCVGVQPVDIAGFKYIWCPECRVLANLEAVSVKHQSIQTAKIKGKGKGIDEAKAMGVYNG